MLVKDFYKDMYKKFSDLIKSDIDNRDLSNIEIRTDTLVKINKILNESHILNLREPLLRGLLAAIYEKYGTEPGLHTIRTSAEYFVEKYTKAPESHYREMAEDIINYYLDNNYLSTKKEGWTTTYVINKTFVRKFKMHKITKADKDVKCEKKT